MSRLLLLALALLAPEARAFVRQKVPGTSICSFWARRTIPFWINSDGSADVPGDAEIDATRRSFENWQAVGCSDLAFEDKGLTARRDVGFVEGSADNVNLVLWRTKLCEDVVPSGHACLDAGTCANQFDCWDHPAGVIGSTLNTFVPRTGQIVDSDIELNDKTYTFSATDLPGLIQTDVENTLTHEIGHMLGLDHTPVPGATMAATARDGETDKRSLAKDDEDGLCAIYPTGAQVRTCLTDGEVVIDAVDSDDDTGCLCAPGKGGLWSWLALLVWLGARRRRRSRPAVAGAAAHATTEPV